MNAGGLAVPMIMGLYPYIRRGENLGFKPSMLKEIKECLECNPGYRERMVFLAADQQMAAILHSFGLRVTRTFEDAPDHVWFNTAHRMKHWMGLWALQEFGEYLWVDWDTVATKMPDANFWRTCRTGGTPKFILILGYQHAVVNCGVLYVPGGWTGLMARSFTLSARSPNDEHLWETVLPGNVLECAEFWFGPEVQYISRPERVDRVTRGLRLAHLGRGGFEVAGAIQSAFDRLSQKEEVGDAN